MKNKILIACLIALLLVSIGHQIYLFTEIKTTQLINKRFSDIIIFQGDSIAILKKLHENHIEIEKLKEEIAIKDCILIKYGEIQSDSLVAHQLG